MTVEANPHPRKLGNPASPQVGCTYDITFPRAPKYGTIRVKVLGADQATEPTPCGMTTVPLLVISGAIPKANPDRMIGPGQIMSLPPFLATWTLVEGGAA